MGGDLSQLRLELSRLLRGLLEPFISLQPKPAPVQRAQVRVVPALAGGRPREASRSRDLQLRQRLLERLLLLDLRRPPNDRCAAARPLTATRRCGTALAGAGASHASGSLSLSVPVSLAPCAPPARFWADPLVCLPPRPPLQSAQSQHASGAAPHPV